MSAYPFQWVDLSEEEKNARRKIYPGTKISAEVEAVKSVPGNVYMPSGFRDIAEDLYNMDLRPDDIWVVTYPKCGTTWSQETVWQIVHGPDPKVTEPLGQRSPFLEISAFLSDPDVIMGMTGGAPSQVMTHPIEFAKSMKSPRIIKSHMPLEFLPPKLLDTCKGKKLKKHQ